MLGSFRVQVSLEVCLYLIGIAVFRTYNILIKMGCFCSKGSGVKDDVSVNAKDNSKFNKSSVVPSRREEVIVDEHKYDAGSRHSRSKQDEEPKAGGVPRQGSVRKTVVIERPRNGTLHRRALTFNFGSKSIPSVRGAKGEHAAAGWPSWLTTVAGDAVQGLLPRSVESFEQIDKVGQGTYSTVFRARDLTNNKIVAMKKVKFEYMDPESVRFMAREISILRKLDHPNVIKLEAIVTSKISDTLYLVFEYMEHDLAGLLASPEVKLNESQIKCYIQQLFRGLQHCHDHGVLHRDIKGSNLLIGNNGILKIGDFGLATNFKPNQKEPLTSRVVTLWYRAPELLFGATHYGVPIDMWSAGCILGELITGKPIMPGRTEVEQMHNIFKLCGSPSEEYWRRSKLTHSTSFKPQKPYKRCILDTFRDFPSAALALVDVLLSIEPEKRGNSTSALKSEFFKTKPLPCDPSNLPRYSPSKELDAKLRQEEAAMRRKVDRMKGKDAEPTATTSFRQSSGIPIPGGELQGQPSKKNSTRVKYNPSEDSVREDSVETPEVSLRNGLSHSSAVFHSSSGDYPCSANGEVDPNQTVGPGGTSGSFKHGVELVGQEVHHRHQSTVGDSSNLHPRVERIATQQPTAYVPNRNMMHFSGPLVPPGGDMDEMLKEHERQIQEAFRKSRLGGNRNRT